MFLTLFLVACLIGVIVWLMTPSKHLRDAMGPIPGIKPLPLIGNALDIKTGHEWVLQIIELSQKYQSEGLFRLWLANRALVGVYKPEFVEIILSSTKEITKSEQYDLTQVWLGTGLLTSTGNKWKSHRKMLTPAFHFSILNDFVHVFNKQAKVLTSKWDAKADNGRFDAFQDITHCALDVICETAMGKCINAQSTDSEYLRAVYRMSHILDSRMRSPWFWPDPLHNIFSHGKEQQQKVKILHDFTDSVIADRLKNFDQKKAESIKEELRGENSEDIIRPRNKRLVFLDLLLYMSDNLTKLSTKDIRDEVDTFMFAGHDTTAASMSWTVHLLGANPEVQAKLHEELDNVFGEDDRDATMEDLKRLKYLECCIKEALRIFPSVPLIGRRLAEDMHFGKYTVPKGVSVIIAPLAIHRNPDIYPDPDKYRPERFFLENSTNRHPYSYIPFSAGPRNCIGQKFGLLEEKTVLSHIFRKFSVKSLQERSELRPVGDLILRPENAIFIQVTPRASAE